MPTPYKQQIEERLWTLQEASPIIADAIRVGNRAKQTEPGWLRRMMKPDPASFPALWISGGRFTHSGYTLPDPTYAMENPGFDGHWIVRRKAEFIITITARGITTAELDPLEEESQDALLRGGIRLGLSFVDGWGPMSAIGEQKVIKISGVDHLQSKFLVPVVMGFDGNELIAA